MISAEDLETVFDQMSESPEQAESLLEEKTVSVIVCDNCGRYFISKADSNEYICLIPENTE